MFYQFLVGIFIAVSAMKYDAYIHQKQISEIKQEIQITYESFLKEARVHYSQSLTDEEFKKIAEEFCIAFAELELSCEELEDNI